MHLLATTSGVVDGGAEAIDLKQSPADAVILTAADSELACIASAHDALGDAAPSLRLANLLQLQHNYSVDLYTEKTLSKAKLIIIRLLGGKAYWPYGVEVMATLAREQNIKLALLPGGHEPDMGLSALSTLPAADVERLRQYFAFGGVENAKALLHFCAHLLGRADAPPAPQPLSKMGFHIKANNSKAVIIFYHSVIEGGQTQPIDALFKALRARGVSTSAIYVSSLKDKGCATFLDEHFSAHPPAVILNATGFAVGDEARDPLAKADCPVLQVALAGSSEVDWQASSQGLRATDLAMNVVLPELDGRIFTRAISFKADEQFHAATQCRIVTYKPVADRVDYVAELAARWAALRATPNAEKKLAIILANYPDKDGRVANGVGYDTPASTIEILKALKNQGYIPGNFPLSGNDLIQHLVSTRRKPGNPQSLPMGPGFRRDDATLELDEYLNHFSALPEPIRRQMTSRWGAPESDPHFINGAFNLAINLYGNIAIAIQPARGYGIDPKSTYHDPALVPPHFYLATYFWLRHHFNAQAIIHNGKHGNLEWLPGKAVGLSAECWPEVALGPLPQLYPFIVNDPGEGTQAKRRASAVIIDHLTPPLTRAESYGPLKDLEALVDEYYLASGLDKRRLVELRTRIFDLTRASRLDQDAGLGGNSDDDLLKLDAFLCDLKEAQIRDGLHILGQSPTGQQEADLLVALTRLPRGMGESGDQSLIRALSNALDFAPFDPLNCNMAESWKGPRPAELAAVSPDPWRTNGDTVERLELLANSMLLSPSPCGEGLGVEVAAKLPTSANNDTLHSTPALPTRGREEVSQVLNNIEQSIRPTLAACGPSEMAALLKGLAGQRVVPGTSGAPTRGRLDVLPTGRNFYSLDNRALPTPTAWTLGQKSAAELLKRHFQDTGQHLKTVGLSAWGTANMRTGGDDIAQALALIGAQPKWDTSSWRVSGFEITPLPRLARPRVDVTLRISGFFRDAFPTQIELLDKAIRAVAALDEPDDDNPLAARVRNETATLITSGLSPDKAHRLSAARIFGAKPGAYGAGLQALIDEGIWDTKSDFAAAYVTWGAYAYGAREKGENNEAQFRRRLASIEAVLHNQDNREHDLLDSDDYYQFEGGMSAAVETQSGSKPRVYHNDHSRPERPVIRTLDEEVARVMRSRVVNPKWIAGVKRHGYKGAFEIAATVDYMFAFAAITGAVRSHHFDLAHEAYILDDDTRRFIAENNPDALKEIAARLEEAIARGLWQPRLNSVYDNLKDLQNV
jgi:cobaltochelatase CobN